MKLNVFRYLNFENYIRFEIRNDIQNINYRGSYTLRNKYNTQVCCLNGEEIFSFNRSGGTVNLFFAAKNLRNLKLQMIPKISLELRDLN